MRGRGDEVGTNPFCRLESDEEVIESLETTPTSSRGGSAKRAREESADVELNADSGVGERQNLKRARP